MAGGMSRPHSVTVLRLSLFIIGRLHAVDFARRCLAMCHDERHFIAFLLLFHILLFHIALCMAAVGIVGILVIVVTE